MRQFTLCISEFIQGKKKYACKARFFFDFARKRGFERETVQKTKFSTVSDSLSAVFCFLFTENAAMFILHFPFPIQNLPLLPCPELLVWLMLPENPAPP